MCSPFDVLEDEIRLPARRDTGIDQIRDIRMPQFRQHRAFAHEALFRRLAQQGRIEQLHRSAALVAAIAPAREPDGAHAAMAEHGLERVRAQLLASEPHAVESNRRRFEQQRRLRQLLLLGDQRAHGSRNRRRPLIELIEPGGARFLVEVERLVEIPADFTPSFLLFGRHRRIRPAAGLGPRARA